MIVAFTAFAIWGGMMWGRPIWGVFWQWEDPRLTTTALLLALYVGYLLFRRLTDDPERRATRAAIVRETMRARVAQCSTEDRYDLHLESIPAA